MHHSLLALAAAFLAAAAANPTGQPHLVLAGKYNVTSGATAFASSPDNKQFYAIQNNGGIVWFDRATDGSLAVAGWSAQMMFVPVSLAFSRDGTSLYVGTSGNKICAFSRDTSTGHLDSVNCYKTSNSPRPYQVFVSVSDDGKNVYGAADSLYWYTRDSSSGALTKAGNVSLPEYAEVDGVAWAGPDLYYTHGNTNNVGRATRMSDGSLRIEPGCDINDTGRSLTYPGPLASAPDDSVVFTGKAAGSTVQSHQLFWFGRNLGSGEISYGGFAGDQTSLNSLNSLAVSSTHVYAGGADKGYTGENASSTLFWFDRQANGTVTVGGNVAGVLCDPHIFSEGNLPALTLIGSDLYAGCDYGPVFWFKAGVN